MKKIALAILCILTAWSVQAQRFTIRGTVEDSQTGEKLISSNVYDAATLKGVSTNAFGFYSLTLPAGPVSMTYSFIGYQSVVLNFNLRKDTLINVRLEPVINLGEVVITADRAKSAVRSTQMSMTELSSKTIKSLPMMFGEVDVLKALQLLPGVKGGNEGTSGIYVRGGGPDQNLILLDGVPVYNANHLFGFFSVFNPDAIQNVKLITGGFPARYGGRLSSVLDIRMRDGNNKKFSAEGSVGLVASKLTVEGPLVKDRTSFILSGRRTYIDVLAQPIIRAIGKQEGASSFNAGYYFYDLNFKVNHKFNEKSRLFLSTYSGKDQAYMGNSDKGQRLGNSYVYSTDAGLGWGNLTAALRWNYVITPKLFSNTTVTYSRYSFITSLLDQQLENDTLTHKYQFKYDSGIIDWAGKVDFEYLPDPNHTIRFGYNQIYHTFKPGVSVLSMKEGGLAIEKTFGNKNIYAHEGALFIEDDWTITPRLKANIGLHFSGFLVSDSTYTSLQPRISARYLITDKLSVKAAFTTMSQYIHLLTNATIGLPTDLWLPSTEMIKPEKAAQYAVGIAYAPVSDVEISLEGYYKTMDNLLEYKEGASFFSIQDDWQNKIELGKGRAYGFEVLARKQMGKTSGWIGYTLSWSERKFENISFGEWFPYRYDRRHDISIVLTHSFNDRIDVGVTWVYGTGNAVTLPLEKYTAMSSFWYDFKYPYFNGIEAFEHRNAYRMPAYHRLDIGINFKKSTKWGQRVWSFGAYNLYNRQNPFYLQFAQQYLDDGTYKKVLKQYSLFPLIPSISYSFKIK